MQELIEDPAPDRARRAPREKQADRPRRRTHVPGAYICTGPAPAVAQYGLETRHAAITRPTRVR